MTPEGPGLAPEVEGEVVSAVTRETPTPPFRSTLDSGLVEAILSLLTRDDGQTPSFTLSMGPVEGEDPFRSDPYDNKPAVSVGQPFVEHETLSRGLPVVRREGVRMVPSRSLTLQLGKGQFDLTWGRPSLVCHRGLRCQ